MVLLGANLLDAMQKNISCSWQSMMNFLTNQYEKKDHVRIQTLTKMHYHHLQEERKHTKINMQIPRCLEHGIKVYELMIKNQEEKLRCLNDINMKFVNHPKRKVGSIDDEVTIEELNKKYEGFEDVVQDMT